MCMSSASRCSCLASSAPMACKIVRNRYLGGAVGPLATRCAGDASDSYRQDVWAEIEAALADADKQLVVLVDHALNCRNSFSRDFARV